MQILYSRCCGIDVHKDSVTACVLIYSGGSKRRFEAGFCDAQKVAREPAFTVVRAEGEHVVMESTGAYWKPVWQALEGNFELILANPYQVKTVPGRKTDARDSQWIAELLARGLIRPSFVPPREIRYLRHLTRHRVKLVEERNRIAPRPETKAQNE